MTSASPAAYSDAQVSAWLRGLLTIAWADGNYDEQEQEAIAELTQTELAPNSDLGSLETIAPADLAAAFESDRDAAENFMRTATIVAVADGVYSIAEADLLYQFGAALGIDIDALRLLDVTLYRPEDSDETSGSAAETAASASDSADLLKPVKSWLDGMDVHDPRVARFICKMVPAQCPFERDVVLFGRKIVHIPAMCKINPLYDQLVGLRFRSLSYLADDLGEDVSSYC
ncbi:MAG: Mo-dependent nitrogenase C-terminal domain-containing protein [Cyanobacteria bacterium J06639_1]